MTGLMQPLHTPIDYHRMTDLWFLLEPLQPSVWFDGCPEFCSSSRYSYLAFAPFSTLRHQTQQLWIDDKPHQDTCPLAALQIKLAQYSLEPLKNLPPFQGGAAGLLGYDLVRYLEKLPTLSQDDQNYPNMVIGFYDLVIAFDHQQQRAWVFSSGLPYTQKSKRQQHATQRLSFALELIENVSALPQSSTLPQISIKQFQKTFTQQQYENSVEKIKEYIRNGDIFQANLSQRFSCEVPPSLSAKQLYLQLRQNNPGPFSAYGHFGDLKILSSSPERFIQVNKKQVATFPIKGTIQRHPKPALDQHYSHQLLNSPKDRAENTMIVDLMRNDLSKVCQPHSIKVPRLCQLESFATVHHLVSEVQGQLKDKVDLIDLLKASLAAGSITGAPKIRAMEIIDELEPTRRGPYCGQMCFFGFDGCFDSSILIRTMIINHQDLSFQVGGAVVLDSQAKNEYHETMIKAQGLLNTLTASTEEVASLIDALAASCESI